MATFTCTACNFSKPVADEMAGKKARCPKCNAVMDIPPLDSETPEVVETSDNATAPSDEGVAAETPPAPPEPTPTEPTRSVPAKKEAQVSNNAEITMELPSMGWLMALGGPVGLVALATILLIFRVIDIAILIFAVGILAFAATSLMYTFGLGKSKSK